MSKVKPNVVGPRLGRPELACITCCNKINNKASVTCKNCQFPICGKNCACPENDDFCQKLSKCEAKNLALVAPLRFLLLRDSEPEVFNHLINNMQDHNEELRQSNQMPIYQETIIQPLKAAFDYDEDLIIKVIGILSTNAFELLSQEQQKASQQGLVEYPALMNHSCVGNTRLVVDSSGGEYKVSVYASVTIPKGTEITFNYVKALDTTLARKEHLKDFKFFECNCIRCSDPTELQTFNSAYLCSKCQVGAIVLNSDNVWTCHDCQIVIEDARIKFMANEVSMGMMKLEKIQSRLDLVQAKKLLSEFEQFLYPTHGFILEIKQVLIMCNAAAVNNPGLEREPEMQRERIRLLDDVLESLDVLEPGLSLLRGTL